MREIITKYKVEYKVKNKIQAAKLSDIKILGTVAEQMDIFFEKRIFSDFAQNAIYGETEKAFRERLDGISELKAGLWRGEFWGKWVISACRVARYTCDASLKEFLHNAALSLIATADSDGYINTYHNSKDVFKRDGEKLRERIGWICEWNWNMWCRKYTLWGLLEVYMLTDDDKILTAAVRHADKFINDLEELGCKPYDTGMFNGLPTGSVLKLMLILYRLTGNKRYLDFSVSEIADDWEREDGRIPNLISNSLANKPVHEWYPNSNEWAKAYEMMSCFDGIIELYRVTGAEKYLTAAKNFYDNVKKYEYNAVFGVSCNDQFYNAANYQNNCTEPCDTIHWMRLSFELFSLTGDIKYMNDMEESFYNPFLAGSFSGGDWGARAVRTSGRHLTAYGQAQMKYSHCCVNNMPRGYMNFAESQLMSSNDTVYINTFTDFEGEIKNACAVTHVLVKGSYLTDGNVNIYIQNDAKIKLMVRIPDFSTNTSLYCLGNTYSPISGEYFALELPAGNTKIGIEFDMNARIVDFEGEEVNPKEKDYVSNRLMYSTVVPIPFEELFFGRRSTLLYGPLLLTRSKKCGNTESEMYENNKTVCGKGYSAKVEPVEANGTRVKFNVTLSGNGDTVKTVMCDYATGSNEYSSTDSRLFSIWI